MRNHMLLCAAFAACIGSCGFAQKPSSADQQYLWAVSTQGGGDAWKQQPPACSRFNEAARPLYAAIIQNDERRVAQVLGAGASPNALLCNGNWSPLMVASAVGNPGVVSDLVAHGADLNYVSAYRVTPTALSAALEYDIPRQDFTIFHYLLDRGADMNEPFADRDEDIATEAATLGQMKIVNELLARGYSRDVAELFGVIKIRVVDERTEPEKQKARRLILAKLSSPEQRKNIPALLDHLRKVVGNEHEDPSDFNSPPKNPERDPDVAALEQIMKS